MNLVFHLVERWRCFCLQMMRDWGIQWKQKQYPQPEQQKKLCPKGKAGVKAEVAKELVMVMLLQTGLLTMVEEEVEAKAEEKR